MSKGGNSTGRTIGFALGVLLRWLICALLVAWSFRIAAYNVIIAVKCGYDLWITHYVVIAVLALTGLGLLILEIVKPRVVVRVFMGGLFCLTHIAFLVWARTDCERPARLYTDADVVLTTPDAVESSRLMQQLNIGSKLAVQRKGEFRVPTKLRQHMTVSDAVAHAAIIDEAWREAEVWRDVVSRLSQFDTVSDLPAGARLHLHTSDRLSLLLLRDIMELYSAHALLLAGRGQRSEATSELSVCHRFARKAMASSSFQVNRAIGVSLCNYNLQTLAALLADGSDEDLESDVANLRSAFAPLSDEELDHTRTFITEYVCLVNLIDETATTRSSGREKAPPVGSRRQPEFASLWEWQTHPDFCLLNETERLAGAYLEELLGALPDPSHFRRIENRFQRDLSHSLCRNLGGRLLITQSFYSISASIHYAVRVQHRSRDLFDVLSLEGAEERQQAATALNESWNHPP